MADSATSGSLGRSSAFTSLFRSKWLWVWPVVAALGLAVFGWRLRVVVENDSRAKMASDLQTILNADVAALEIWLSSQKSDARAMANDVHVRTLVEQLVGEANEASSDTTPLLQSPALGQLREELQPWIEAEGFQGFLVVAADGTAVAGQRDDWIGKRLPDDRQVLLEPVFAGDSIVTRPQKSLILLPTDDGQMKAGVPTMFALAPVRSAHGDEGPIIAALGVRIRPEGDFTRILGIARAGESGETYAFDKDGVLLSQSRFDEQLKQIGLITDDADTHSILNLQIRDPEVDMTLGKRPKKRRSEQPLTRMAQDATAGDRKQGVNVEGYRDYRGVSVVGAWVWLDEYGFGVATEVDVAEAYQSLYVLRTAFGILFALLVAAAIAIFIFTIVAARLQRRVRRAALETKQLGQYSLDEKIGSGGMGVVYRARHAMLHRPTAVKLLDVDKTTDETIARFEREVQLTSQLTHPNTIAIYDFGRTPEGIFYYAMEYLEGITLEELVRRFGPQPEGRVIHVLRQVCGSLAEAHKIGLIHRDVKPANVMLTQRGGILDFAKLLDFGLVKAIDQEHESKLTADGALTGTPLYISPEGVQKPGSVDARSDLYSVGAVGYWLLTGKPLFEGQTAVEICMSQLNTMPEKPSTRLGKTLSLDLEELLLECLAKSPDDRPQTARDLAERLDDCQAASTWSQAEAEAWWLQYADEHTAAPKDGATSSEGCDETMVHDREPPSA